MKRYAAIVWLALAVLAPWAQADTVNVDGGMAFFHRDWEVACDNTRTCRIAGYQQDGDEHAISVLLIRKAGPAQPVTGELMVGAYDEEDFDLLQRLGDPLRLSMTIDGVSVGAVSVSQESLAAKLSQAQVAALLAALPGHSTIEFSTGDVSWHLSDDGAAAVLLKVDDYQRRVGTRGALARKGTRDEADVAPALPVPGVHQASVVDRTMSADALPAAVDLPALREALAATTSSEDCDLSPAEEGGPVPFRAARLDAHHLLVSAGCWLAAYNSGSGFWVIDDSAPYQPVLVTTIGSDYGDGRISSSMKGRGLGDCWSTEEWAWDGRQFVHTASSTSGMCKLLAPGGAWSLPTIVTKVR
ncbi:DUF1176 domain-containing protein [Frateuria sp.]|uniref:DUF1176 domain-containing protein n=1 Tax=Frateuria sp. TaxID=2211372 RepID=UPI003F811557